MPVMERETVDEVAIGSTREKRKRAPARCPGRCMIECTPRSMPHFLVVVSGAACERRGMPEDSGSIRPAGAGRGHRLLPAYEVYGIICTFCIQQCTSPALTRSYPGPPCP